MFRKLPGVKKPESPVVWIFGLFILYLSKKIERRRNAVLTKTKGFYDSGIIPKQKVYMMRTGNPDTAEFFMKRIKKNIQKCWNKRKNGIANTGK